MSTNQFRRYLDLLNEADLPGQPPSQFIPTHFHKNFLGGRIPLMQTPDGKFWWMTNDSDNPRAGKTIQPWVGNTTDRSSMASVDGTIVNNKPVEFPTGTNWQQNSEPSQSAAPASMSSEPAAAAAAIQPQGQPEDGTGLAGGQRCAICGTPTMAHSDLKHQFQLGGDARPDPVPQGPVGGDDNLSRISRIKDLQRALLAAGADLGKTGIGRNGIDGDIGPLTRAAMQKYPDIAAKYADLPAGQDATPAGKSSNIEKLNAALTAIEGILAKYKVKLNEDRESSTPADQMKQWRSLVEYSELNELDRKGRPTKADIAAYMSNYAYGDDPSEKPTRKSPTKKSAAPAAAPAPTSFGQGTNMPTEPYQVPGASTSPNPTPAAQPAATSQPAAQRTMPRLSGANLTPAQQAAQRAGMGMPSLVGAGPYATQAAQTAGTGAATATTTAAAKGAVGAAGAAVRRALPGVGLAYGAYDAYNRAKEGDYVGAGIAGLSGLAAFLPVVGIAASLGLTGLNYYLDSNKTPTVAIAADDAKIIADNIKIIQDWQKDPANQSALTPELKNRIANVLKGVSTLGVPTAQAATPATSAQPAQPATTPAAPTANLKVDQINQTLNSMDQLLKKNKFESANNKKLPPLTESERMARLRDIVTEDVTDYVLPTVGAAATGYGAYHGGRALEKGASKTKAFYIALRAVLKLATKAVTSMGKVGLLIGTGILLKGLYDFAMADPQAVAEAGINAQDIEEFNRLNEQLKQLIGDNKNFDALPPDVQQKIKAMHQRIIDMTAKIINQEAGGQK